MRTSKALIILCPRNMSLPINQTIDQLTFFGTFFTFPTLSNCLGNSENTSNEDEDPGNADKTRNAKYFLAKMRNGLKLLKKFRAGHKTANFSVFSAPLQRWYNLGGVGTEQEIFARKRNQLPKNNETIVTDKNHLGFKANSENLSRLLNLNLGKVTFLWTTMHGH